MVLTEFFPHLISFRGEGECKHCLLKQDGRLFVMGEQEFESLIQLVAYYQKRPLYKKVRLKYPVPNDAVVPAQAAGAAAAAASQSGSLLNLAGFFLSLNPSQWGLGHISGV